MTSNLLLTLAEFKTRTDSVNADWTATESTAAERVIEAVSRKVEQYCGRQFYATGTGTTRHFTAEWADLLVVPDLISIDSSGLVTDEDGDRTYERTWQTTDYDLLPFNASELSEPYTSLVVTPRGSYSFPLVDKGVKIAGNWGWSTTPPQIVEAVFLESARVWQEAHSPSGVVQSGQFGQWVIQPQLHPTTLALIADYRRDLSGAI